MDTVFYVGNKFCGLFLLSRIIEIFDDLIHKITYSLDYFPYIFFSNLKGPRTALLSNDTLCD